MEQGVHRSARDDHWHEASGDAGGEEYGSQELQRDLALFNNLLNLINYNNEMVADSVIIDNPDRLGQYILLKREMAEKILLLGMI